MAFVVQGLPGRPGEKGSAGEPVSPSSLPEFIFSLLLKLKGRDGPSNWDERGMKLACETGSVPECQSLEFHSAEKPEPVMRDRMTVLLFYLSLCLRENQRTSLTST